LRASPTVSAFAVLSLALCIGANTAAFSMFDGLALRSPPVREPDRLALLTEGDDISSWTTPIWQQLRDRPQLFEGSLAWNFQRFAIARGGPKEPVEGLWTSGRFFEVLGVPAPLGRTLRDSDDRSSGGAEGPVVVISHGFWMRRFGGASDVVGRTLTLDRVPFTIVGVSPPGFLCPEVGRAFDVAVPIGVEPLLRGNESLLGSRSYWWLKVMVRLKPGQALEAAAAALATVRPQILDATVAPGTNAQYQEEHRNKRFLLEPAAVGGSELRRTAMQPLAALTAVVALVLLVACVNIAHLALARASARRHELSVRTVHGSPAALARSVASAIGAVDPSLAITFRPLEGLVDAMLVNERLLATLSSFFGGLALLLAALGLFGVTSYGVSRHRTEIAIRIAPGALPVRVPRLVLGRVAVTVGIGIGRGRARRMAAGAPRGTPRPHGGAEGGVAVCTTGGLQAARARRRVGVGPRAVLHRTQCRAPRASGSCGSGGGRRRSVRSPARRRRRVTPLTCQDRPAPTGSASPRPTSSSASVRSSISPSPTPPWTPSSQTAWSTSVPTGPRSSARPSELRGRHPARRLRGECRLDATSEALAGSRPG